MRVVAALTIFWVLSTACQRDVEAAYTPAERAAFVPACTQAFGARGMPNLDALCACVYDTLEQTVPYDQAAEWMQQAAKRTQADTPLDDLLRRCYAQSGGATYPAVIRRHLLTTCEATHKTAMEPKKAEAYCACYIAELEKRVPIYDANRSHAEQPISAVVTEKIKEATQQCLPR